MKEKVYSEDHQDDGKNFYNPKGQLKLGRSLMPPRFSLSASPVNSEDKFSPHSEESPRDEKSQLSWEDNNKNSSSQEA